MDTDVTIDPTSSSSTVLWLSKLLEKYYSGDLSSKEKKKSGYGDTHLD
jgi:hypothetical protein